MDPADVSFSLEWRDVDSCHSDSDDDNPRDVQSSSSSDSEDIPPPFSSSVAPLPSHSCPSSLTSAFSALSVMQNDPTVNSSSENTPFIPRGYQLELYRRALDENIIICVETGAGKTLISALLIKHILERSETQLVSNLSSPRIVVFLVHRVTLVQQQAKVIENIIPRKFRVGCYHGDRGVDNWSPERWASNIKAHSVLVMTAQIFLNLLRHALIRMDQISLLIVDEAHHATKSHPYCRIFLEFYHCIPPTDHRPRVFGMTATPVKAKNASAKHANCLSAISELEATMDSTVVTVSMDAQNEVESLVPKPDEYVVSYIPSSETPQYCTEDGIDSDVLNDVLYNAPNYQNKSLSDLRRGMLPTTEMNLLARLNENIGFVAAKDIAIRFCEQRKIRPDDVLNVLLKQSEDVDPSHAAVRDKAFRLLDVLYFEYMRCKKELDAMESNSMDCSPQNGGKEGIGEKFRTIVFTHERVSALALSNLINEVFSKHECSQLTACPIVGTTSQALSIVRMSQSSMNKTIEAFRDGKFGILVATNVVEEGIDVPACRLVVTFDPPFSPAAYVQGRGRARKRGAHYISLVATGTEEDYNLLLRSREGARVMKDVSRGAYVTEKQRREMRAAIVKNVELKESMNREKILFSRTMPARVSAVDAVNLLIRYCNLKGQIMGVEDIEEPKFEVIADRKMWKATVTLDKRIPVDVGFCTEPQLSQQHAKRIAALDAYSKLYIVGEINDHLLPNKGKRSKRVLEVSAGPIGPVRSSRNGNESASSGGKKKSSRKNRPAVESKASKKHKRMRVCQIAHPLSEGVSAPSFDELSNRKNGEVDGLESDDDDEEIIVIDETSDSESTRTKTTTRKRQRPADNDSLRGVMDGVPVHTKFKKKMFVYKIDLMSQLETQQWASRNSTSTFGIILHYKIRTEDLSACECPSGKPLLMLTECGQMSWNEEMDHKAYQYVRAIQICLMGKTPGSTKALEMDDYYQNGDYQMPVFFLLPLIRSDDDSEKLIVDWFSVEKLLSFGWRCGPLQKHEMYGPQEMENVLVCSLHERLERVYISDKLNPSLKPDSPSDGYIQTFATFKEYYECKHNVVVKDTEQCLLPGHSLRETLSGNTDHVFMLVPEFIRIVPLDPLACYIASVLPFWQTFMALRDCWNRNRIRPIRFLEFARALQPNVNNVCNGNADLCYERAEFLGDSVLKVINSLVRYVLNPGGDEGDLSDARDIEVSNGHLADIAMGMKLQNCLAYSGIAPKIKSWPWYWGSHERKPLNVSEKVLADCLEALIGAHYQSGGFISACLFLERHGLLPGACDTLGIQVNRSLKNLNVAATRDKGGLKVKVPRMCDDDIRHDSSEIAEVEDKIGYTFREKKHLVIALTHGSWGFGRCTSYQKYEYLGDAIVGFLLLSHFHDVYPHLGPNELTKLRGPALSNNLFARVITRLGIHRLFWYSSVNMKRDIDHAATAILNENEDEGDICAKIKVPKVLGDLFEAIIGAIVVDQGMRLDVVRTVTLRLLQEQLDRFANPYRFKDNVISKLLLIVQKQFQTCPDYVFLDGTTDELKRCQVWINNLRKLGEGVGPTRAIARRNATEAALKKLGAFTGGTVLSKDHDKRVASNIRQFGPDVEAEQAELRAAEIVDQRTITVYDQDV